MWGAVTLLVTPPSLMDVNRVVSDHKRGKLACGWYNNLVQISYAPGTMLTNDITSGFPWSWDITIQKQSLVCEWHSQLPKLAIKIQKNVRVNLSDEDPGFLKWWDQVWISLQVCIMLCCHQMPVLNHISPPFCHHWSNCKQNSCPLT